MRPFLLYIATLCSLALTACDKGASVAPVAPPAPKEARASTYLALGDSYTIGQSVPEADQWGRQLVGLLRADSVEISNPVTIAQSGWTTSELALAIAAKNPEPIYDMVSLLIGVNNQYRGQSIDTYRTEFSELLETSIRLAKGNPEHVLVLSIPDWGTTPFGRNYNPEQVAAEIDLFNAVAKEVTEAAGIPFINITTLTREAAADQSYIAGDGLHYSGKMHREWALLALPYAKQILK